ncbi:MAG: hypothetical protein LBC53_06915, partial [Spirochaetaceae bacterium]|nr:hypothetical protein [Spirochaetaceae bacterium]
KDLINKCIEHLKEIYAENNGTKVFVTSDSETFLAEAKKFPFVYVIDGEVRHIDAPGANNDAVLKVFLDFFVLSHSKKVYLVVDGKMYNSGFSQLAALVNNVPFYINKY